jgi:hypothetical protein
MRARGATAAGAQSNLLFEERSKWVNVTWMPHASLSQTSHVCLAVRSVLTCLDDLKHYKREEWQVRATIYGVAGLPIVPISSLTPTAPVTTLNDHTDTDEHPPLDLTGEEWLPMASSVTHICKLDSLLHIPLRWRDLPRDSCVKFEILGHCDEVVS